MKTKSIVWCKNCGQQLSKPSKRKNKLCPKCRKKRAESPKPRKTKRFGLF